MTQQQRTKLPGMFPVVVNARDTDFTGDNTFSLGALADSFYEYLPKVSAKGAISHTKLELTQTRNTYFWAGSRRITKRYTKGLSTRPKLTISFVPSIQRTWTFSLLEVYM